ncbi:hypothetical protein BD408DRAFT_448184 [Parasitella parasitica]|nr:hypothetical protein BD408DRAFT_448184 [Parasitella parasitica]
MAKGKEKKAKREKLARKQRRTVDKNFFGDPENLDAQLENLGLCTKSIAGDGNCLFRSLSDQYHGHDGNHKVIRKEICQYLRENEETYKFFVEDDQSFENHVECMSQDATFGGNMELAAFARLKEVDIKVYQPGMIYIINGNENENEQEDVEGAEKQRQILHIAYHSWEHYSSVRNIDGPNLGPPEIKMEENIVDTSKDESYVNIDEKNELTSKEKVVRNAHPDASIHKIRRLLIKYKGNPDKVIDIIYDLEHQHLKNQIEDNETAYHEIIGTVVKSTAEATIFASIPTTLPQKMQQEVVSIENMENVGKDDLRIKVMENKKTSDNKAAVEKEEEIPYHLQYRVIEYRVIEVSKEHKKLSAADRKKEQKKRQKENRLMKERAKAARKAGYNLSKHQVVEGEDGTAKTVVIVTKSMKEMYI